MNTEVEPMEMARYLLSPSRTIRGLLREVNDWRTIADELAEALRDVLTYKDPDHLWEAVHKYDKLREDSDGSD